MADTAGSQVEAFAGWLKNPMLSATVQFAVRRFEHVGAYALPMTTPPSDG
jgi:hypothetical protein